jgi:hypothetical protein
MSRLHSYIKNNWIVYITILLWLFIVMLLLSSCSRKTVTTSTNVTDTTTIREIIRYDTIRTPGDTIRISELIECDSITNKPKPITIRERVGRATASVTINNQGQLQVQASCDSLENIIRIMDKEIFRLRHETKTVYYEKKPSKFKQWIDNVTYTLLGLIILYFLLRLLSRIIFKS